MRRFALAFFALSLAALPIFPQAASAQSAAAGCRDGSRWFSETMIRLGVASIYAQMFLEDMAPYLDGTATDAPDDEFLDRYAAAADDLEALGEEQASSKPPREARTVNGKLAERFERLASAYGFLGGGMLRFETAMEQAAGDIQRARELGEEAVPLVVDFVETCELRDDQRIELEVACLDFMYLPTTDWFKSASGTLIYAIALEADGLEAIEAGDFAGVDETIASLRAAAQTLLDETGVDQDQAYVQVVYSYLMASADLFEAAAYGGTASQNQAYAAYEDASAALNGFQADAGASCAALYSDL
jgi:hypothetical protein